MDYTEAVHIAGLIALSAFGFYALKLVSAFRTGILARSWKHVSVGALFLILAQVPLIVAGISGLVGEEYSLLIFAGTLMRFIGIVFLTIGFRIQCQVWRIEKKNLLPRTRSIEI